MASEEAGRRIREALQIIASSQLGSLCSRRAFANLRALLMLLTSRRMGAVDRCLDVIRRTAQDSALTACARLIRMTAGMAALLENGASPAKPVRAVPRKK